MLPDPDAPTGLSTPVAIQLWDAKHPLEVAGVTAAPVSLTLIPCQQLRFIYIHSYFAGTRPASGARPPCVSLWSLELVAAGGGIFIP